MPMPKWVTKINKRIFNPMEIGRGKRPVLEHVGRTSGKTFHTPLDAHRVEGGFIFFPVYGVDTDWIKNIQASGTARLTIGGEEYELVTPRVISREEAWRQLPETTKAPPSFLRLEEFFQMDLDA